MLDAHRDSQGEGFDFFGGAYGMCCFDQMLFFSSHDLIVMFTLLPEQLAGILDQLGMYFALGSPTQSTFLQYITIC